MKNGKPKPAVLIYSIVIVIFPVFVFILQIPPLPLCGTRTLPVSDSASKILGVRSEPSTSPVSVVISMDPASDAFRITSPVEVSISNESETQLVSVTLPVLASALTSFSATIFFRTILPVDVFASISLHLIP